MYDDDEDHQASRQQKPILLASQQQIVNYDIMHLVAGVATTVVKHWFLIKTDQSIIITEDTMNGSASKIWYHSLVLLCKFISINHNNLPCLSSLQNKSGWESVSVLLNHLILHPCQVKKKIKCRHKESKAFHEKKIGKNREIGKTVS